MGAAILGKVGGEMMITDRFIEGLIAPNKFVQYGVEAFFAAGVIVSGKLWMKWKIARGEHQEHIHGA